MYLDHFGMQEPPFAITPDTSYFYNYGSYQEALNVLLVALRSGEGFLKITGEVGTGKTLLCRKLLAELDKEAVTAYLPNPCLTPAGLRYAVADELGVKYARNMGQHRILSLINDRLIELHAQGKRVVLLMDEAQALPDDSLEALRLLTNLETEKNKLLQVVLFGQPELEQRLAQQPFRQLRQRITFSYRMRGIDREGLPGYLAHRLLVAGYHGKPLFTQGALDALYKVSRGVPRLVNILAHKTLMAAYGQGVSQIGAAHVGMAVEDTDSLSRQVPMRWRYLRGRLLGGMGLATLLCLSYYLGGLSA